MKGRLLAALVVPFLGACGVLIGAEWDGTLLVAQLDGPPIDEDSSVVPTPTTKPPEKDAAPIPKTCSGDARYCVCRAGMPKLDGGVLCGAETVSKGGFCCKGTSYPIQGKCVCSEFRCGRSDPELCSCGPAVDGGLSKCTGAVCCFTALTSTCNCFDTGIQECLQINGDEVRVPSCELKEIHCASDEQRTDDCGYVTAD